MRYGNWAHMVVRWHKLGEVDIECTLINSIVFVICMPRIIVFDGDLTKFWQEQVRTFFSGTPCIYMYYLLPFVLG